MKRHLSILLIIILIIPSISSFAFTNNDIHFSDIDGHWAESIIEKQLSTGLINGYPDQTFQPEKQITHAELVSLINRFFGLKAFTEDNFVDVENTEWYAVDAAKAKYYQYIEALQLNPSSLATREETVNILSILLDIDEGSIVNETVFFSDIASLNDSSKLNIKKFAELGYIEGYEDGSFLPSKGVSRAEILKLFEKTLGYVVATQEDADNIPEGVEKVTIINSRITIENQTIMGTLFISPGVNGPVTIKNSHIIKQIEISGGNSDSPIVLDNVETKNLIITNAKESPLVQIKNKSEIQNLKVKSIAIIEFLDDSFAYNLGIEEQTKLMLKDSSNISNLTIDGEVSVTMTKDTRINSITSNSKTDIQGDGHINFAFVNSEEVSIEPETNYVKMNSHAGTAMIAGNPVNHRTDDYVPKKEVDEEVSSEFTDISIFDLPFATDYMEGDTLDLIGLIVEVVRTDTSIEYVEFPDFDLYNIKTSPNDGDLLTTNNTSVAVSVDNLTASFDISVVPFVSDTEPPNLFNDEIYDDDISLNSITIGWTQADDNQTDSSNLLYQAYYSLNSNLYSLEEIKSNGTSVQGFTKDITSQTFTALSEDTSYYFNVIVKDASGNETTYWPSSYSTLEPVSIASIETYNNPNKTTYTEDDLLDLSGLEVRLYKSDGTNDVVAFADFSTYGITSSIAQGASLTTSDTSVIVSLNGKTTQFNLTVKPKGLLSGEGSAESPFIITKIEDLIAIGKGTSFDGASDYDLDSAYELANDLDFTKASDYRNSLGLDTFDIDDDGDIAETLMDALTKADASDDGKGFKMLSGDSGYFYGSFDGNNFTISNLYMNRPAQNNASFIGQTSGATIKNITLNKVSVNGADNAASLIGFAYYYTAIDNCHASGEVVGTTNTGGLIGNLYYFGTLSNSSSTATVTGTSKTGGLIGNSYNSIVSNSFATGSVTGANNTGGLIGYLSNSTINHSYFNGNVLGGAWVGGLVGFSYVSSMDRSSSSGTVIGDRIVGGLAGSIYYNSSASNCYSTSDAVGGTTVGGFTGEIYSGSSIVNSFSTGTVTGTYFIGSFMGSGYWDFSIANSMTLSSSMTSTHDNDYYVGRFGGNIDSFTNFLKNYAKDDMSVLYSLGLVPIIEGFDTKDGKNITSTDSTDIDFYLNPLNWDESGNNTLWDFDTIWELKAGATHPTLR